MEPKIYKPGAYETPGVYNGAGDVYNGRGVYNDGTGGGVFYYDTDFSNFDLDTGEDNGLFWTFAYGKTALEKTQITIGGMTRNALKFSKNTQAQINFDKSQIPFEQYTLICECCLTESNSSSSGGLEFIAVSPYYNLYDNVRGIGVKNFRYVGAITKYNGFYEYSADTRQLYSNYYDKNDYTQIIDGGMSVDTTTGRCGAFLFGKKAIEGIGNLNTSLDIYNIGTQSNLFVLRFAIQEGFLFDELE